MVKEICLHDRQGKVIAKTIVDDDVFDLVRKYRWSLSKSGYAVRNTTMMMSGVRVSRTYYLQRIVLGLKEKDRRVGDHINEDKLDNRRENLQAVPRWMNGYGNLPGNGTHIRLAHVQPSIRLSDVPLNTKKQEEYSFARDIPDAT